MTDLSGCDVLALVFVIELHTGTNLHRPSRRDEIPGGMKNKSAN
jgi:hypothetical protein